jgi:hypothetical protein
VQRLKNKLKNASKVEDEHKNQLEKQNGKKMHVYNKDKTIMSMVTCRTYESR